MHGCTPVPQVAERDDRSEDSATAATLLLRFAARRNVWTLDCAAQAAGSGLRNRLMTNYDPAEGWTGRPGASASACQRALITPSKHPAQPLGHLRLRPPPRLGRYLGACNDPGRRTLREIAAPGRAAQLPHLVERPSLSCNPRGRPGVVPSPFGKRALC